jgi:hypothetical protein
VKLSRQIGGKNLKMSNMSAWQKLLQGTIVAAAALTMTGCEPVEFYDPTPTPGPTPIVSPSLTPVPPAPTVVPSPTPTPYVPPRTNTGYGELPIDTSLLGKEIYYSGTVPWTTASDKIVVARRVVPAPNCPTFYDEFYLNVGVPKGASESISISDYGYTGGITPNSPGKNSYYATVPLYPVAYNRTQTPGNEGTWFVRTDGKTASQVSNVGDARLITHLTRYSQIAFTGTTAPIPAVECKAVSWKAPGAVNVTAYTPLGDTVALLGGYGK